MPTPCKKCKEALSTYCCVNGKTLHYHYHDDDCENTLVTHLSCFRLFLKGINRIDFHGMFDNTELFRSEFIGILNKIHEEGDIKFTMDHNLQLL